ncbi:MAG: Trk system potassium transporter TrkA [Acutalibacteraceae bacterium]|nr:Trk system potassium transporter TrkA [Oscillospiraceae bacterium]
MNIVIVGCGKVGSTLADQLVREGHDVSVIDIDPNAVKKVTNRLDVLGVVGSGSIHNVQVDAGVEDADLFIAVTPSDELNLLCCLMAKKSASCNTIARVRNPDYLSERSFFKERLGLSAIINPEYEAACEISRLFCIPSAIEVDTFAGGKVELLKAALPEDSPIAGKSIMNALGKISGKVLICAVERGDEVIIPTGSFVLRSGDEISFITSRKARETAFKKAGLDAGRIKRIVIVGGGKISFYLVNMLVEYGFKVKIIEKNKERCEFLSSALPSSVVVINGDGTDQQLLYEEGIDKADGFASLTDIDEENIMLSMFMAKSSKAKVVTKINRQNFADIINNLNIGSVIYPKFITAETIVSYARALKNSQGSNVQTLYNIVGDKVEALEFLARSESEVIGVPLSDLELKDNLLICCIGRNGKTIIPNGLTTIEIGDTVVVVTTQKGLNDLRDILK